MNKFTFGLFLSLLSTTGLLADQSVTLMWDNPQDPTVTGSVIYYGNSTRNYPYHTNALSSGPATVMGLQDGLTYYFAVTATNSAGLESDYSNELIASFPAPSTNTFPSINWPGNIRILENTTTNIPFVVWDVETYPGLLSVAASSGNQALLPNSGITVTGNTHNRTLTLTPSKDQFGDSAITIVCSDGTNVITETFVLTVLQVPTPMAQMVFVSKLQVSDSPTGPWKNILTTTLPVEVPIKDGKFYRTWLDVTPP